MQFEIVQLPFRVTDDPVVVDYEFVYRLLSTSYWANDRPKEVIEVAWRSPATIPFTAWLGDRCVGFARVITDRVTFAWVADVMVDQAYRGQGVGKLLVRAIVEHPAMQRHVRMCLGTRDAHALYEAVGFVRREMMWRAAPSRVDPLG